MTNRWCRARAILAAVPLLALGGIAAPATPLRLGLDELPGYRVRVQAAPTSGTSVEELKAAIDEIKRRLAEQRAAHRAPGEPTALAQELEASARRISELSAAVDALRGEREQLRTQLAMASERASVLQLERDTAAGAIEASGAELGRLTTRVAELERGLAERSAQLVSAGNEIEAMRRSTAELEASNGRLEASVREARAEVEARSRERAEAMAAEIEAAQDRAKRLDAEIGALRDIAGTSVKEVQSLGEQLLAALAENQELVAALGQLRATREMLDGELAAARREATAAQAEPAGLRAVPAAGPADPALVRLASNDGMALPPSALEATLEVEGVGLANAGDGWMMTIPQGLDFAPGSDRIAAGSTASLEKVASLIRGYGTPAVRIVGHTDAEGEAGFNRRLSQRRAQAVRGFLVERYALEPRLITTEGYGEERPIAGNATWVERQQNRRVEIYVKP